MLACFACNLPSHPEALLNAKVCIEVEFSDWQGHVSSGALTSAFPLAHFAHTLSQRLLRCGHPCWVICSNETLTCFSRGSRQPAT